MDRGLNSKQKLVLFLMLFASLLTNIQRAQGAIVPGFYQHTPTPRTIEGVSYSRAERQLSIMPSLIIIPFKEK